MTGANDPTPTARARRRVPRFVTILGVATIIVALVIAGAAAWMSSENALAFLVEQAVQRSDGRVSVEGVRGSALGRIEADRVVYRDEGTVVTLENVAAEHVARSLVARRLHLRNVTIGTVKLEQGKGDDTPPSMPDSLALPIDVSIDQATIGRVEWRTADDTGSLDGIALSYTGGAEGHRVRDLVVRGPGGTLAGEASVGAQSPFAVTGRLTLDLVEPHPTGRVQADIGGDLRALAVRATSNVAGVDANGRATLAPFAAQPLVDGHVEARALDVSRFDAKWPVTRLDVVVDARPSPGGFTGSARVANAAAGPIDSNRVPVANARADFTLAGVTLTLRELVATTPGGGSVAGGGTIDIDNGRNRWKLAVDNLDLAALHTSLVRTALDGNVEADVTADVQRLAAEVAQQDLKLAFDATYDGRTVVAKRLLAQARNGVLEGSGRLAVDGARPFAVDLRARGFDPARFGAFPSGSIDGSIAANGTLSPSIAVNADVAVSPGSRFAGLAAQGRAKGSFAAATKNVHALSADVALGATRVQASGAVGRPGDRVVVKVDAKRLAELERVLPDGTLPQLSGAIAGTANVETLARNGARVEIDANATNLRVGDDASVASLRVAGRATHAADIAAPRLDAVEAVSIVVTASGVATPEGEADRARVAIDGSAARHTIVASIEENGIGADGRVNASLAGAGTPSFAWRGALDALSARGLPGVGAVALASPASFDLGRDRVVLGAFRVEGNGAVLDVERVRWSGGTLDSAGRFRSLPIAPFVRLADLADRFPTDLTLGGAWDVTSKGGWSGTLRIAREGGDVYIDDPTLESASKVSLGLTTLALNAQLDGTRVTGDARLGTRLGGTASADFVIAAAQGSPHPFTPAAAVRAQVRAKFPSLAALQPWIGTTARVQGEATADLTIGGTLGKPRIDGEVTGNRLRVDMPQHGVSYRDGRLRIVSAGPEGLKLEELSFAAGDGRFVASGTIALPSERGAAPTSRIAWRAENFRALNRPDRRLVVDGEGTLALADGRVVLRGKVNADEGSIQYRATDDTRLASDIVVVNRARPGRPAATSTAAAAPIDIDLDVSLGRDLRFNGEGFDGRLGGRVQIVSKGGGPITGKGVIRIIEGTYYAFGQRLDIDRGRIIFDGPLDNPSLDIVALRKKLPVEAGVEVVGTVRAPLVRLTSNPPVPDNEKLAWLITGGPPGSESARESAAIAAAASVLSGRNSKPLTQRIAQSIGLDDISVARRATTSASSDPLSGSVVSLGKRITDRLYVAYEQGLTLADNALRLEYILSRYLTIAAFAGTNSGVALNYRRSWR